MSEVHYMKSRLHRFVQIIKKEDTEVTSIDDLVFLREEAKYSLWRVGAYLLGIVVVFNIPSPREGSLLFRMLQAIPIGFFAAYGARNCIQVYYGYRYTYLIFYMRLLEYQISRDTIAIRKPSLWYFFFKDLKGYEDELRAYVRHYERNMEELDRQEKWEFVGNKLTYKLQTLLPQFSLTEDEKKDIFDQWESIFNPKKKREFLTRLEGKLLTKAFRNQLAPLLKPAENFEVEFEDEFPVKYDRVASLEEQARNVDSEESKRLVELASRESNQRIKLRLLQQAIRIRDKVHASKPELPEAEKVIQEKKSAEVHFLSLQDLARERFSLVGIVPREVNPIMAREIILALLSPGESGRRFTAAYRAEDTLRVRVRKQFEVHLRQQFNPKMFRDNLGWLEREQVLFTKPKTDEQVYALSSKTRGKSLEAQKVIRAFMAFDRSLRIV